MRTFICSLLIVTACLACGCSGKKQVKGKITKGGQPFTLSDKGQFVLSFISEGGTDKTTYNATVKTDGTFTIVGPENKGIPPGKYKVNLTAQDPYSPPRDQSSGAKGPPNDKLEGKFAPGKSTLVVEVGSGDLEIKVD